jgi:hypothetical protein
MGADLWCVSLMLSLAASDRRENCVNRGFEELHSAK